MPTTLRPLNPPTALPVSLATAKLHCKVEHSADDALITAMIRAAARSAEQQLNRALMEQPWLCSLDEFPATGIVLGKPRVIAITSIIYTNPAGTDITLPGSAYTLDADALPGLVLPALGTTWPATRAQPNAVRVTFTAGYGADAAAVPDDVAGHWRAQFDLTADGKDPVEMRLFLRNGEEILSETWLYQYHPG